jgi:hypothetical protein
MRPLAEAWKTMAYLSISPAQARAWFSGDEGTAPKPPDRKKINETLSKNDNLGETLKGVNTLIRNLDGHAHLSPEALIQTNAGSAGFGIFGATYQEDYCRMVISWATFCIILILHEFSRDDPSISATWVADLASVESLRDAWHQEEDFPLSPEEE